MKHSFSIGFIAIALAATHLVAPAQTTSTVAEAQAVNPAIVPVSRPSGKGLERQNVVMERAKAAPGTYDIVFIGDSITQGWERSGSNVWTKFYGDRKCLNLGVGGDRTEHVLWRFENGQLDGLDPKVAVLMIGTNNSNTNKDGSEHYSTGQILEGVQTVVKQIRERLPQTKLLVLGIFPRSTTFSPQRGRLLQINQALAKQADGKMIHYLDFGSQLVEADGSISKDIMPDHLHLSEKATRSGPTPSSRS